MMSFPSLIDPNQIPPTYQNDLPESIFVMLAGKHFKYVPECEGYFATIGKNAFQYERGNNKISLIEDVEESDEVIYHKLEVFNDPAYPNGVLYYRDEDGVWGFEGKKLDVDLQLFPEIAARLDNPVEQEIPNTENGDNPVSEPKGNSTSSDSHETDLISNKGKAWSTYVTWKNAAFVLGLILGIGSAPFFIMAGIQYQPQYFFYIGAGLVGAAFISWIAAAVRHHHDRKERQKSILP